MMKQVKMVEIYHVISVLVCIYAISEEVTETKIDFDKAN